LALRAGLLTLGHDYLRDAVQSRWLNDGDRLLAVRRELATYFSKIPTPTDRKLDEYPALLRDLAEWERLKYFVGDIETCLRFGEAERHKWDRHHFWSLLQKRYDFHDVFDEIINGAEQSFNEVLQRGDSAVARGMCISLRDLAGFSLEAGAYEAAESIARQ